MKVFMSTSGFDFDGYRINEYLGYCSADYTIDMDLTFESLENKLAVAKSKVLERVETNARSIGANALIGLDINYTVFSPELVVVEARGTAVVAESERVFAPEADKPDSSEETLRFIPAINSSANIPLQVGNVRLSKSGAVGLVFEPRDHQIITALNVDFVFRTIYGGELKRSDVRFTEINHLRSGKWLTESVKDKELGTIFDIIKDAVVHINNYVCEDVAYADAVSAYSPTVSIETSTAGEGVERWRKPEELYDDGAWDDDFDEVEIPEPENIYKQILRDIEMMDNAKEIDEYITEFNQEHGGCVAEKLLKDISDSVLIEKVYMNQKSYCVNKVKEYAYDME